MPFIWWQRCTSMALEHSELQVILGPMQRSAVWASFLCVKNQHVSDLQSGRKFEKEGPPKCTGLTFSNFFSNSKPVLHLTQLRSGIASLRENSYTLHKVPQPVSKHLKHPQQSMSWCLGTLCCQILSEADAPVHQPQAP